MKTRGEPIVVAAGGQRAKYAGLMPLVLCQELAATGLLRRRSGGRPLVLDGLAHGFARQVQASALFQDNSQVAIRPAEIAPQSDLGRSLSYERRLQRERAAQRRLGQFA